MSTVVSAMDEDSRDARTYNIAVVEPARKRILWTSGAPGSITASTAHSPSAAGTSC